MLLFPQFFKVLCTLGVLVLHPRCDKYFLLVCCLSVDSACGILHSTEDAVFRSLAVVTCQSSPSLPLDLSPHIQVTRSLPCFLVPFPNGSPAVPAPCTRRPVFAPVDFCMPPSLCPSAPSYSGAVSLRAPVAHRCTVEGPPPVSAPEWPRAPSSPVSVHSFPM